MATPMSPPTICTNFCKNNHGYKEIATNTITIVSKFYNIEETYTCIFTEYKREVQLKATGPLPSGSSPELSK